MIIKIVSFSGWKDGSVDRVLTMQALSFAPNTHVKRPGMRAHSSTPSAEAVETVQYLGIPD